MPDYEDDIFGREEAPEQEVSDESEKESEQEVIDESEVGQDEERIDEGRRRLLCGLGALTISLPFIALGTRESCSEVANESPTSPYLGKWENSKEKARLVISPWPEGIGNKPNKTINLGKMGQAKLILPVTSNILIKDNSRLYSLIEGTKEFYSGIYDINGLHVLVFWFEPKEFRRLRKEYGRSLGIYLAFGLRKKGEILEVSNVPKIQKALLPKSLRSRFSQRKQWWTPLKRVSQ